jgi:hypothetical protein
MRKKEISRALGFCILGLCLYVQPTWAQSKKSPPIFAVLGLGVNQLDMSQSPALQDLPPKKNHVGLLLGGEYLLKSSFSVELNLVISNFQYVAQPRDLVLSERSTRLHFPVLLRWTFWQQFAIGLGGYASYRMGDVERLTNHEFSSDNETSAHNYGNHGLEGSFRFLLPLSREQQMFLSFDYRHIYSLTAREGEKEGHQSFLLSLRRRI